MSKKNSSNKSSAYDGYQYGKTTSSYYVKNKKRKFPVKWLLVGLLAVCVFGVGTYFATSYFQTADIQNTNEETRNMDVSVITGEEKVKSDWEKEINKIYSADSDNLQKYGEVIPYAINYKVTEREYKTFKEEVVESFETGSYLKTNDDVMLANIFKSYVVNEYTSKETDLDFKLFISNYNQTLAYIYRGYESADSDFVKEKENLMISSLEKMESK